MGTIIEGSLGIIVQDELFKQFCILHEKERLSDAEKLKYIQLQDDLAKYPLPSEILRVIRQENISLVAE